METHYTTEKNTQSKKEDLPQIEFCETFSLSGKFDVKDNQNKHNPSSVDAFQGKSLLQKLLDRKASFSGSGFFL